MKNWGECYYDHFEKYLGQPTERYVIRRSVLIPSIQIATYENIFQQCIAYCSLGATHYSRQLEQIGEIFLPVTEEWEEVPDILASTIFALVENSLPLVQGQFIRGFKKNKPEFVERCGKTGLFFTTPKEFPKTFSQFQCEGQTGKVYLAFFITDAEFEYAKKLSPEQFEELLETKSVDIYDLRRASIV